MKDKEYTAKVGATMVNVSGHQQHAGVPFAGSHAAVTTVTVNFKPASGVGDAATGVQVWSGDDSGNAVYIPFDDAQTRYGKKASKKLPGDLKSVHFRIVDNKNATSASAGTAERYEASVWKLAKFDNAYVMVPSKLGWTGHSPAARPMSPKRKHPPRRRPSRMTSRIRRT